MYPSGNYRCAPPHLAARYALEFWVLRSLSAARALAAEFLNQAVAAVGGVECAKCLLEQSEIGWLEAGEAGWLLTGLEPVHRDAEPAQERALQFLRLANTRAVQ